MNRTTQRTAIAFTVALLSSLATLHAADWPQWGGTTGKNMVSLEEKMPESFVPGEKNPQGGIQISTTKNVKWIARVGDFSCGTPTVAGSKVFLGGLIGEQGILKCFDEATGKLLWQWIKPCRSNVKADAMNFRHFPKKLGVCSTPAVDGQRLYFVDQNCVVECLDINGQSATAGGEVGEAKVIWTFDMYADKAVGSPHRTPVMARR